MNKIIWENKGSFAFYRIQFQVYGEKTTAFYKSHDGSLYHIQFQNGIPIFYYKIFTFK